MGRWILGVLLAGTGLSNVLAFTRFSNLFSDLKSAVPHTAENGFIVDVVLPLYSASECASYCRELNECVYFNLYSLSPHTHCSLFNQTHRQQNATLLDGDQIKDSAAYEILELSARTLDPESGEREDFPPPGELERTSSKRGVAYLSSIADASYDLVAPSLESRRITWTHNGRLRDVPWNIEFVPTVAGDFDGSELEQALQGPDLARTSAIMASPEFKTTSGITLQPRKAAQVWKDQIEPLKQGRNWRLGAPGISNSDGGDNWFKSFLEACAELGGCDIDFVPISWNDWSGATLDTFPDFVRSCLGYGYPVWVANVEYTSMINPDNPDEYDISEFKQMLQFLEQEKGVERYVWSGPLLAFSDGVVSVTTVGKVYLGME